MPAKKQKTTTSTDKPAAPVRIFDVAPPGTLPPADATARPVIVTNRTIMHDPMMTPPTAEAAPKVSQKIVIQPLSPDADEPAAKSQPDTPEPDAPEPAAPSGFPMAPARAETATPDMTEQSPPLPAEPPKSELKPEPKPAQKRAPDPPPVKEPEPEPKPAPEPKSAPDATTDPASSLAATNPAESTDSIEALDADKAAAQLEADAKIQDELDTLVEEKTYFLPINSVVQRRSRHVFIFGTIVILILAAAWLDIAIDAGFITIPGIKPITHLFHN